MRGPKYVVKKGKTSVLTPEEARALLDSIPVVRTIQEGNTGGKPCLIGLRDRAEIASRVVERGSQNYPTVESKPTS